MKMKDSNFYKIHANINLMVYLEKKLEIVKYYNLAFLN